MVIRKLSKSGSKAEDEPQTPAEAAEELAKFRAEWKADLNQRLKHTQDQKQPAAVVSSTSDVQIVSADPATAAHKHLPNPISSTIPLDKAPGLSRGPGFTSPLDPKHQRALDIYGKAVTHEQRGELDEALVLYKQAFRIHEDVSRLYERIEYNTIFSIKPIDAATFAQAQRDQKAAAASASLAHVSHGLEKLHISVEPSISAALTLPANHGVVTGTLANLMAPWASLVLAFEPEDEKQPVHMQTLPDELLVHILAFLDTTGLERFALVNRRARVLALDPSLWRYVRRHSLYTASLHS